MPLAIRGLITNFFRASAERGWSVSRALSEAQLLGLKTYRRTEMLRDYRSIASIPLKRDPLIYTPKKYQPGEALYTAAPYKQVRSYRYEVRMRFYDPITGRFKVQYTNVESDDPMTIQQVEDQARGYFRPSEEEYALTEMTATIHAGFKKYEG